MRVAFFEWDAAYLQWRRRLPHVTQTDSIYFVTFRVADSIPAVRLAQWKQELAVWKYQNRPPLTQEQEEAYANLGYRRIERWLDQGHGSCPLVGPAASEVQRCLTYLDGKDYRLGNYAVMPNHVHALVQMMSQSDLRDVVRTWRKATTHSINHILGRRGALWQSDWFDHIVRDAAALARIRDYIRRNGESVPCRALTGCGTLFG